MALHVQMPIVLTSSQLIVGKDTTAVSTSIGKKSKSVNVESSISPQFASVEKVKVVAKVKLDKSSDPWNPTDFERDASYFELTFNLPNEGENPYIIIMDVIDEMLSTCFREKASKSGYKLSYCTGIPVVDVLHLSQVVDSYDKPVNGVLALTFVKGVYAKRILKRKINWAAYASVKLRGQILQWEREKKGKPDGPPCVRKPRVYRPSFPFIDVSDLRNDVQSPDQSKAITPAMNEGIRSLEMNNNIVDGLRIEPQPSSLLLEVLQSCILATKAQKANAVKDSLKVQSCLEALETAEHDQPTVANLSIECRCYEMDLQTVKQSILCAERKCKEWQMELELEQNKEGQEFPDYVVMVEEQLKKEGEAIEEMKDRERKIGETVLHRKKLLEAGLDCVDLLASMGSQLRALAAAVQDNIARLELDEDSQKSEYKILASILLNPSSSLRPTFIPTTSVGIPHHFEVSNCPVSCYGFHCHNWIPASCGHAYHPSCLFPLIGANQTVTKQYSDV